MKQKLSADSDTTNNLIKCFAVERNAKKTTNKNLFALLEVSLQQLNIQCRVFCFFWEISFIKLEYSAIRTKRQ